MKSEGSKAAGFDRADALVGLGALLIGAALWFLMGWPGVLAWAGFLVMAIGVAEARRKIR